MYGVVEIKGHQYRVETGDLIDVEKMDAEAGTTVDLTDVLFIGGGKAIVGAPTINGASVKAKVLKHDKGEKLIAMKRSPGKYRKRLGHRQQYTALLITEISDGNNAVTIPADHKNAKKFLK